MSPLALGLDLGSTTSKAVLLAPDHTILGQLVEPTRPDPAQATTLRDTILQQAGVLDADLACIATGYGRSQVSFAARAVTEITCHARGVRFHQPDATCILDIGGQDSKALRLGANGHVEDFAMNDRCAAGTGSFLEVIARRFGYTLADLAALPVPAGDPLPINATCVVFAESEAVGLRAHGHSADAILWAITHAAARRVALLLERLGTSNGPVEFTGGVAQNPAMLAALSQVLARPIRPCPAPQFTGALGAALLALELEK